MARCAARAFQYQPCELCAPAAVGMSIIATTTTSTTMPPLRPTCPCVSITASPGGSARTLSLRELAGQACPDGPGTLRATKGNTSPETAENTRPRETTALAG